MVLVNLTVHHRRDICSFGHSAVQGGATEDISILQ